MQLSATLNLAIKEPMLLQEALMRAKLGVRAAVRFTRVIYPQNIKALVLPLFSSRGNASQNTAREGPHRYGDLFNHAGVETIEYDSHSLPLPVSGGNSCASCASCQAPS